MTNQELYEMAVKAREFSYSPYSNFKVGAALLAKNGTVYTGCNIENAAYTPCNCAERTAFFKAVSEGVMEFEKIAVVGGKDEIAPVTAPCGVCRQVMMEFCNPKEFTIIMPMGNGELGEFTLEEILPFGFGPANLA